MGMTAAAAVVGARVASARRATTSGREGAWRRARVNGAPRRGRGRRRARWRRERKDRGDGRAARRAPRASALKTRAARNAVKGGRAAPPAMMPAVFDDAMSMSFDEDEDEVDEETTLHVGHRGDDARRLRSRRALGKPLMTKKPTPVATTPNAKAAKKTGRKTAKKMDWQSFVDWKRWSIKSTRR